MQTAANTNAIEAITVTGVRVVTIGAKGQIVKTRRGARTYRVAMELSDGSLLVRTVSHDSRGLAAVAAGHVLRSLESGAIRRELRRWDEDERAMYDRVWA